MCGHTDTHTYETTTVTLSAHARRPVHRIYRTRADKQYSLLTTQFNNGAGNSVPNSMPEEFFTCTGKNGEKEAIFVSVYSAFLRGWQKYSGYVRITESYGFPGPAFSATCCRRRQNAAVALDTRGRPGT